MAQYINDGFNLAVTGILGYQAKPHTVRKIKIILKNKVDRMDWVIFKSKKTFNVVFVFNIFDFLIGNAWIQKKNIPAFSLVFYF